MNSHEKKEKTLNEKCVQTFDWSCILVVPSVDQIRFVFSPLNIKELFKYNLNIRS